MQNKILSVFYAEDRLPYKDASRTTHYPIVSGSVFNGANNVTTIRFYVDQIGGVENVTWVVVSKLPNGQIANEVLNSNNAILDEELNEHYLEFNVSSYYTTLQGNVFISLSGYQGGVEVEQDIGTGIYSIYGTPTIQATGSIKIGVNYAPQILQGTHFTVSDLQQVLGLISDKSNVSDVIVVLDDISNTDLSGYNDGQIFYDKDTMSYYIWSAGSQEYARYDRVLYYLPSSYIELGELYRRYDTTWFTCLDSGDLCIARITKINTTYSLYAYVLADSGLIKKYERTLLAGSQQLHTVLATTPDSTYATQDYCVPRTSTGNQVYGTNSSGIQITMPVDTFVTGQVVRRVDENSGNIYVGTPTAPNHATPKTYVDTRFSQVISLANPSGTLSTSDYALALKNDTFIIYNQDIYTKAKETSTEIIYHRYMSYASLGNTGVVVNFTQITITKSTRAYTHSGYAPVFYTTSQVNNLLATLRANAFIKVDTTTYPTLADFLASTGTEGYIYLYPIDTGDLSKGYKQYIYEGGAWLFIGDTNINLQDYYTKAEIDTALNDKVDKTQTIAGVDLQDNITAQELTTALGFEFTDITITEE